MPDPTLPQQPAVIPPTPQQAPVIDERKIPPADLWDQKVKGGMSPDSATAYVSQLHGPPPTPAAPAPAAPVRQSVVSRLPASAPTAQTDATTTFNRKPAYTATPTEDLGGALRTVEQGATFGFGDELNAGIRHVATGEDLSKALADERRSVAGFKERNPAGAFASEALGGLAGGGLAGEIAKGVGLGAKAASEAPGFIKTVAKGAAAGGAAAAGTTDGSIADRIKAIPRGMEFGGMMAGTMAAGGNMVKGAGKMLANQASKDTPVASTLRTVGVPTATDLAKGDVLKQIQRSGLTVDAVRAAAGAAPPEATLMDIGGGQMLRRARGVQSIPSRGSEQIDQTLSDRIAGQPGRVQGTLADGLSGGNPRENAVTTAKQLSGQRLAAAKPLYDQAYKHGALQDPQTLDLISSLRQHPVFERAWQRGQAMSDLEAGVAPLRGTRSQGQTLSIRDNSGALRRDLGSVSDDELENEWHRLVERHSQEDALHSSVQDAGYRSDYEELPHTEKFGRPGQEDLPDADGKVDAERLASDNKTVSDYNRGAMVRSAQERSIKRIEDEMAARSSRPSEGGVTVKSNPTVAQVDSWKKGLDAVIESSRGSSDALSRSESRLYRQKLNDVLGRVDKEVPVYGQARQQWSGDSDMMDAHDMGRNFSTTNRDELSDTWNGLSEGEKDMYRRGALSELSTQLGKVTDGRDVTRIFQNPLMREKLSVILPNKEAANQFFSDMATETKLHKNAQFVRSGSPTARIMAEQSDALSAAAEPIADAITGHPIRAAKGMFNRFANSETRGLTEAQADAMGPILTSKGGDLAAALSDLDNYATKTGRAAGQRAATVRATAQVAGGRSVKKRP